TASARRRSAVVLLWTLRGAPHLYWRADLARGLAAVAPFSSADAAKRIFDAARSLRAAGIDPLAALDQMAEARRSVATGRMPKGEVSTAVTRLLPPPFLRYCRSCQATHAYEQVFRLGATRAGLELVPDTSPGAGTDRPAPTTGARPRSVRTDPGLAAAARAGRTQAGRGVPGRTGAGGHRPVAGRRGGGAGGGRTAAGLAPGRAAAEGRPAPGDPAAGPVRPVPAGPRPVPARARPAAG